MSLVSKLGTFLRLLFLRRNRRAIQEVERLKRMVKMVDSTDDVEIACEEVYRLLDQYAEILLRGEDPAALMPQVKHHLEMCMDCREELEVLLEALRSSST